MTSAGPAGLRAPFRAIRARSTDRLMPRGTDGRPAGGCPVRQRWPRNRLHQRIGVQLQETQLQEKLRVREALELYAPARSDQ